MLVEEPVPDGTVGFPASPRTAVEDLENGAGYELGLGPRLGSPQLQGASGNSHLLLQRDSKLAKLAVGAVQHRPEVEAGTAGEKEGEGQTDE